MNMNPMMTLAISEFWTISMFVINLIVGILVAWLLLREKQRDTRITNLEQNLETRAEQLIESKLSGVASHLEGVVNVVNERVSNIRERLRTGDSELADLDKRDRELETRFNLRFDQLKDYLHQNFATKDEVKENVRGLHRRIDTIKQQQGTP